MADVELDHRATVEDLYDLWDVVNEGVMAIAKDPEAKAYALDLCRQWLKDNGVVKKAATQQAINAALEGLHGLDFPIAD